MTTCHNQNFCRKSTVYNQTGQSYFEQLSAYNHMSAHLRRILLAHSVVDSRNKKYYTPDKRTDCRSTSRSKSLDKILSRRDIIDGIAYDTEHHPIDVLRMSLESDPEYRRKKKQIADHACARCNDVCHVQCRGLSPIKTSRRTTINPEIDWRIRRSRTTDNSPCPIKSNQRASCGSAISCRFPESGSYRKPEVDRARRKICVRDDDRVRWDIRKNREPEVISETGSGYNSSFESASDTSETESPTAAKKIDSSSPRSNRVESVDRAGIELDRKLKKLSDNDELTEEAKYAKFLYDITQEIMLNGLYTDQELRETFKKHMDINSSNLDKNKMQTEIYQLKISLNVTEECSEDNEDIDVERFVSGGRFANQSPPKPPTPPKILDDNKVMEKLRNHEESSSLSYSRRRSSKNCNCGKNTVLLVDANPEMLITERDVLATLMEMKLDPRQVQTICKNLQNKSRETIPTQTVDSGASHPQQKKDRGISPIIHRTERSTFESIFGAPEVLASISTRRDERTGTVDPRDRMTQVEIESVKKTQCDCQCKENNARHDSSIHEVLERKLPKDEKSQTKEEKPEVAIQASPIDSQSKGVTTSTSLNRINEPITKIPSQSSESEKGPEATKIKTSEAIEKKIKTPRASVRGINPQNRRKSSSEREPEDSSDSTAQEDKAREKKMKRSSSLKKSPVKYERKSSTDSKSTSKSKKELVDDDEKVGRTSTSRRLSRKDTMKSAQPKKSATPRLSIVKRASARKSEESKEQLQIKSPKESIAINEMDASEKSDAADILTEQDSSGLADHVEIDEITDEELTSLSEDISQIIEESSTIVDLKNPEESRISETTRISKNLKFPVPDISNLEKLRIIDESEEEDTSMNGKSDPDFKGRSKNYKGSKELAERGIKKSSLTSKSDEDRKGLTPRKKYVVDGSDDDNDDDLKSKERIDEESSISEDLLQSTFDSGTIVIESKDHLKSSRVSSLSMEKEEEIDDDDDDDEMVIVSKSDQNSKEEIRDREIQESDKTMRDRLSMNSSRINVISEETDEELNSLSTKEIDDKASKKKRKTVLLCGPCCGKLILRIDSDQRLEAPRTKVKNDNSRRKTTFREDPMTTTASDISLLKREDLFDGSSSQLFDENAPEVEETWKESNIDEFDEEGPLPKIQELSAEESIVEEVEKEVPLPWITELPTEESKFELSAPRRDTIHRKTSLIRTLRNVVENIGRRSGTSDAGSSTYKRFSTVDEASSETVDETASLLEDSSMIALPGSKKKIQETIDKAQSSSENSSSAMTSPESKKRIEKIIHKAQSSSKNSSSAMASPESKKKIKETIDKAQSSSENGSSAMAIPGSKKKMQETIDKAQSSSENSSSAMAIPGSKKKIQETIDKAQSSSENSSSAMAIPGSKNKIQEPIDKAQSLSENSSSAMAIPGSKKKIQETIDRAQSSSENSSSAMAIPGSKNKIQETIDKAQSLSENSSSAMTIPRSKKKIQETIDRAPSSSENSSSSMAIPGSKKTIQETIDKAQSSSENSSSAMTISGSKKKIQETIDGAQGSSENNSIATSIPELKEKHQEGVDETIDLLENSSIAAAIPGSKEKCEEVVDDAKNSFKNSSSSRASLESREKYHKTVDDARNSFKNSSNSRASLESREKYNKTVDEGRSSLQSSSSSKIFPKSMKNASSTMEIQKMTKTSSHEISSQTEAKDPSIDKNVLGHRNIINRCRSDCRGFMSAQQEPHLYASNRCERIDSSSSESIESIDENQVE